MAAQAGKDLQEIENVSGHLAELINSISLATKQQARGAEAVSKSMNEISEVTQQTATGTKQTSVAVSHLATLADGLRDSVSLFKLPEESDGATRIDQAQASSIAPTMGTSIPTSIVTPTV